VKTKTKCAVGHCTRYKSHEPHPKRDEGFFWVWVCRDHWRRIPKRKKAVLHRLNRLRKRYGDTEEIMDRWRRTWDRLARMAGELPPVI
jgi:hypothetical protein